MPEQPGLYVLIAVLCLVVAMKSMRRAPEPVGVVAEMLRATFVVAFAMGVAFVFVLAAALTA